MKKTHLIYFEPFDLNWTEYKHPEKLSLKPGKIIVNMSQKLQIKLNNKILWVLCEGEHDIDELNKWLKDQTGLKNTKEGIYDIVFLNASYRPH